jgi:hypothetical protein
MKTCIKCGQSKLNTLEFFAPARNCKDGIGTVCRICRRIYMKDWKTKHADTIKARNKELYAAKYAVAQSEKRKRRLETKPLQSRAQIMRWGILERSRVQNTPVDADILTTPYIMEWIRRTPNCPCCGRVIDYGYKEGKPTDKSPSIDQIKPGKGYVVSNVALICWRCNNLKRDATADELDTIVRWMRSHEVPL